MEHEQTITILISSCCSILVALFIKKIWERFLSKSSRVTPEWCLLSRKQCEDRLKKGDIRFIWLEESVSLMLLTQYKLCEHFNITNCDDLKDKIINQHKTGMDCK